MRSRTDVRLAATATVLASVLWIGAAAAEQDPARGRAGRFAQAEIARAIDTVKADPNIASERTIKTLRWNRSMAPRRQSRMPAWLLWIAGLFRWFEQ